MLYERWNILIRIYQFRVELKSFITGHILRRVTMKFTKLLVLFAVLALFTVGGCSGSESADDSEESTSGADAQERDADVEIAASSETATSSNEDSEYDAVSTDINYDHFDAGIPDGFPDVIPVYDIANSTVMGGMEQDAGGTMVYNLILGSNDQVSEVSDVIVSSVENINMNIEVEGSTMLMGDIGDWNYTITIDNGEADGFVTIITYSIVEKQ